MSLHQSERPLRITDLPPDILYNIFPYLSIRNFVNLTNCTRAFFPYRQDPAFWSDLVRKTFRVPAQPLLEGKRWQWLYKKLLTQTKLYTWGDNKSGNLGHARLIKEPGYEHLRPYPHKEGTGFPDQPWVDIYIGIISDVQCGGWCTTLLNKDGNIFIMGLLDGFVPRYASGHGHHLRQLTFPPQWYISSNSSYWPNTAIKQYSTGRSQVLGLSDSGKVWQWRGAGGQATLIVPLNIDLEERRVLEVQAGWDRSAVLIRDIGIAYWAPEHESDILPGGRQESLQTGHSVTVNPVIIPGTSFHSKSGDRRSDSSLEARIGEIKQFVVLAAHIVFTTHTHRIFSYATTFPLSETDRPDPVELTTFHHSPSSASNHTSTPSWEIRALAGSFNNFAVFISTGVILTATRSYLDEFHRIAFSAGANDQTLPHPNRLPELQTSDIISLSFGDHHMHALHANGTISSLGVESQSCGALGLGNPGDSPYRGVLKLATPFSYDGHLPSDRHSERRTIWFEPMMLQWLRRLARNTILRRYKASTVPFHDNELDDDTRIRYGDYFEREARFWMDTWPSTTEATSSGYVDQQGSIRSNHNSSPIPLSGPDEHKVHNDAKEADLPPYFALKVASAGWHSAALVLVDDEKVQAVRQRFIVPPPPVPEAQGGVWGSVRNLGRKFLGLKAEGEGQHVLRFTFDQDALPES